jgi:hypothetical protein
MPTQIGTADILSGEAPIDVVAKATRWRYVCKAIDILTGERAEEYPYEAAIVLFVIKSWLSSTVSLLFAIKYAPAILCSMLLSEEINETRGRKEFRHKSSLNLFNRAIDNPNLTPALNASFQRMNIIDFLLKITWRPYHKINPKRKLEIERLNELTGYRLRLGNNGYNFGVNDAAPLLGAMRNEKSWGPTTVKGIRKRWREKEAFLFIARSKDFYSITSFSNLTVPNMLSTIEEDAKNHQRNADYFSTVKGIIAQLTPEVSKELEKDERWRKIVPRTIALSPFSDDERNEIEELSIIPMLRRSAKETKAAHRHRPPSK